MSLFVLPLALLLDWCLGEPRRAHPLVMFGRYAEAVERRLYQPARVRGAWCWLLVIAPLLLISYSIHQALLAQAWSLAMLFELLVVYAALGHRSLHEHALRVVQATKNGDQTAARQAAACLVSRDEATLDPVSSTLESVLENGNDAVFAALFWYAVAGVPGVVLYRLANTLDAMWGYRNARFQNFGWAAARLDDALNWLPARLTAASYTLQGHSQSAWRCWQQQGALMQSPNAGPVMAAGAGALQVRLGGPACYQGVWKQRPVLGCGDDPQIEDVQASLRLLRHTTVLWVLVIVCLEWACA